MVKVRLLAIILTLIEAVGMILSLLLICAMVVMVPSFHFPLPRIQIIIRDCYRPFDLTSRGCPVFCFSRSV